MRRLIFIGILVLSQAGLSRDIHPVSISWIHADLQDDRVLLNVKISAEDLIYFHDLTLDQKHELSKEHLLKAANEHIEILQEAITISDENDLEARSQFIKSNFTELQKTSYHVMDLVKVSLHYQFEFELSSDAEFISFIQRLSGVPSISFLSISKNGNELVKQKELRSDEPFTIKRDATSIGSVSQQDFMLSYFSISDTKVTHEITLPITLLQSFIQLKSINIDVLNQFITENSSVEVDGITITPTIETLTLMNGNIDQDASIVNVRIGYSIHELPKKITLEWEHFNWNMRWFESIIDAFGKEEKHTFSRFKTKFETERKREKLGKN